MAHSTHPDFNRKLQAIREATVAMRKAEDALRAVYEIYRTAGDPNAEPWYEAVQRMGTWAHTIETKYKVGN